MEEPNFDELFSADEPAVAEADPVADVPAEETVDVDVEEEVQEVEDAPETVEEAPVVAAVETDLPEGVVVSEKNGKKTWSYPEERGRSIYEGYQLAREAETVLGEPLTADALRQRQDAFDWKQNMRSDFLSPNPEEQKDAFYNLIRDAGFAIKDGEIGHDPVLTAGETMLQTLKEHAPEAFERASKVVLNDYIATLYRIGRNGDVNALRMAQNLDQAKNGKFMKDDQVSAITDPDPRETSLTEREQALERRAESERRQGFDNWWGETRNKLGAQVESVVEDTIRPIADALKAFPDRAGNIKKLLHGEVKSAIQSDATWREQTALLKRNAERAPSEAKRAEYQQQLEKRYAAKARIVLSSVAPKIMNAEMQSARSKVTAVQTRVRNGANNREPQGAASPAARMVPQSGSNGPLTRDSYADAIDKLFA